MAIKLTKRVKKLRKSVNGWRFSQLARLEGKKCGQRRRGCGRFGQRAERAKRGIRRFPTAAGRIFSARPVSKINLIQKLINIWYDFIKNFGRFSVLDIIIFRFVKFIGILSILLKLLNLIFFHSNQINITIEIIAVLIVFLQINFRIYIDDIVFEKKTFVKNDENEL